MRLGVFSANEKELEIGVEPHDQVRSIKMCIQGTEGIPRTHRILLYSGKPVNLSRPLRFAATDILMHRLGSIVRRLPTTASKPTAPCRRFFYVLRAPRASKGSTAGRLEGFVVMVVEVCYGRWA